MTQGIKHWMAQGIKCWMAQGINAQGIKHWIAQGKILMVMVAKPQIISQVLMLFD